MAVLLHQGHQHAESASTTVGYEMMLLLTIGLLVLGAIAVYGTRRYTER